MPIAPETVSLAGSGLVFENSYGPGVTDAFRAAIVTAENAFQSQFVDAVTVTINFDLQALDPSISGHNVFHVTPVSYEDFVAALTAHATTPADHLAVAGLPTADPSGGLGFWLGAAQARALGLATAIHGFDDDIVLNSALSFDFGADAVGVLEHEISEGVFGRVSSLGHTEPAWQPMDLFRFGTDGQRDFTGGADGAATFFGLDSTHVTGLQLHNALDAAGHDDGFDLADWDHTLGDAFGPSGPGAPGVMTPTDLEILDVLGWTPAASAQGRAIAAASSLHADPLLHGASREFGLFGGPEFLA